MKISPQQFDDAIVNAMRSVLHQGMASMFAVHVGSGPKVASWAVSVDHMNVGEFRNALLQELGMIGHATPIEVTRAIEGQS